MKQHLTMLFILAVPLFAIAADEIKKESSVKIQGKTKIETDTYTQGDDRVLEIKRIISLSDDNHMTQQNIMWKDSVVVEFDISHMSSNPGQFIHFHSFPGVNAVTDAKPDGTMKGISLVTTNLTILRSFTVVDGLLSPIPVEEVKRANAIHEEVKDLFTDFQSGDASKDEFLNRANELIKKNQNDGGTTR